jgi:hypothetical protein
MAAVQRLAWFNHGFMRTRVEGDLLELGDLRMGSEPDYAFGFAVAQRMDGQWQAIPPRSIPLQRDAGPMRSEAWQRIWRAPEPGCGRVRGRAACQALTTAAVRQPVRERALRSAHRNSRPSASASWAGAVSARLTTGAERGVVRMPPAPR